MEDIVIEDARSNSVPYRKAFAMIDGKEVQYSTLNPKNECPTNHGDEVYLGFGKVHSILSY
ncbi:hypothetical protein KY334_01395 [Candidatus Woesearchaeota archaeon]|nr:hypothetical protein [Candidatus Woesearchaeota archaeon]